MTDSWSKIEEAILDFWENNKVFEKSLERRKKAKPFVFYEGPPGANGQPGIHHFIGRVIKDLFCRYWSMKGYKMERRSGWDTHGLPVELEVEKELGLGSKKEIETYGLAKFNQRAKESVWRYKEEWERFTKRIGFWLDLKNPYVTYQPEYIETLWWIIQRFWKKKLLYRGHKVVPFCPRCGTPLSSHEVAQGYRNIEELSVYVKFPLWPGQRFGEKGEHLTENKIYLLSWTTTPWTLPGNVALAVGKEISYVVTQPEGTKELLIVAENLVDKVFAGHPVKRLYALRGRELLGLQYKPLFEIEPLKSPQSYKVYEADFVTTAEGTGIVHTAVMYGEDDYRLGEKFNLPKFHTVTPQGKFRPMVPKLAGRPVKDQTTEKIILDHLRDSGFLFREENYRHDYPFCWRCQRPLLYYATASWFVAMSSLEKKLQRNNQRVNWYPAHLKTGRFGEWLKGVKDWAFSRERYWGTPLPVWQCQADATANSQQSSINNRQSTINSRSWLGSDRQKGCGHYEVIGSLAELEKKRFRQKNDYLLMRHGFSTKNQANINNFFLANDRYPLTVEGRERVEKETQRLKKRRIDLIFTSPFLRTKETAEIVSRFTGAPLKTDERLGEINHGSVCEGKNRLVCLPNNYQKRDLNYRFGDGESWQDVRRRMVAVIREIEAQYQGKNILIVSHGDPLVILAAAMNNWSDEKLLDLLVGTTQTEVKAIAQSRSLKSGSAKTFYPLPGEFFEAFWANWPRDEMGYLDLHRPSVDEIFLRCPVCRGMMRRVPEVVDVWFDSGAMPWAQWHYPFENKKRFRENFPADFIAEGVDQTRGWFYTLLAVATALGAKAPFKNVVSYNLVLDAQGQKMSKSKGNVADPWEVMEKFGADAARWYFYAVNSPGEPKLFSLAEVALRWRGFIQILLNTLRFFELYADPQIKFGGNFHQLLPAKMLDRWLLARLLETIQTVSRSLEQYDPTTAARTLEKLVVEDFSQWWLRRSRSRFQQPHSFQTLTDDLSFLRFFLLELAKLLAPFTPFLAEHLHLSLHRGVSAGQTSVHWHNWPSLKHYPPGALNQRLIGQMANLRQWANWGLALRQSIPKKIRQPLKSFYVFDRTDQGSELSELLKEELNVKEIIWATADQTLPTGLVFRAEGKQKVALDPQLDPALIQEGWGREVIRQIQEMRKEKEYHYRQLIAGGWQTDHPELNKAMIVWQPLIEKMGGLKNFSPQPDQSAQTWEIQKKFNLAPQVKIWLGLKKC